MSTLINNFNIILKLYIGLFENKYNVALNIFARNILKYILQYSNNLLSKTPHKTQLLTETFSTVNTCYIDPVLDFKLKLYNATDKELKHITTVLSAKLINV